MDTNELPKPPAPATPPKPEIVTPPQPIQPPVEQVTVAQAEAPAVLSKPTGTGQENIIDTKWREDDSLEARTASVEAMRHDIAGLVNTAPNDQAPVTPAAVEPGRNLNWRAQEQQAEIRNQTNPVNIEFIKKEIPPELLTKPSISSLTNEDKSNFDDFTQFDMPDLQLERLTLDDTFLKQHIEEFLKDPYKFGTFKRDLISIFQSVAPGTPKDQRATLFKSGIHGFARKLGLIKAPDVTPPPIIPPAPPKPPGV